VQTKKQRGSQMRNKWNTKVVQAILLCLGYNADGKLIADGEWGENSQAAARQYLVAEGPEITDGKDVFDVIAGTFMEDGFGFDLGMDIPAESEYDVKVMQAFLICVGFSNNGQLIADGEWGEHSQAAAHQYLMTEGNDTDDELAVRKILSEEIREENKHVYFYPIFRSTAPENEPVA